MEKCSIFHFSSLLIRLHWKTTTFLSMWLFKLTFTKQAAIIQGRFFLNTWLNFQRRCLYWGWQRDSSVPQLAQGCSSAHSGISYRWHLCIKKLVLMETESKEAKVKACIFEISIQMYMPYIWIPECVHGYICIINTCNLFQGIFVEKGDILKVIGITDVLQSLVINSNVLHIISYKYTRFSYSENALGL